MTHITSSHTQLEAAEEEEAAAAAFLQAMSVETVTLVTLATEQGNISTKPPPPCQEPQIRGWRRKRRRKKQSMEGKALHSSRFGASHEQPLATLNTTDGLPQLGVLVSWTPLQIGVLVSHGHYSKLGVLVSWTPLQIRSSCLMDTTPN
jgi:hypothetical protein